MKQVIHSDRAGMVTHLRNMAREHWHAAEVFSPRGARAANERGIAAGLDQAAGIIEAWVEAAEVPDDWQPYEAGWLK